ncbi:MAG: hypothetical protein ABUL50_05560 [Rhizobacter sp.]
MGGRWPAGAKKMHFDERDIGDYRVFAGALEGPMGDGYIAALIVQRVQGVSGAPREALRDESLACGHRWASPADALAYAMNKATDAIRNRPPRLAC